jgi:hypothetical protein
MKLERVNARLEKVRGSGWRERLKVEEITLRGILIPDEIDKQFNVTSLLLSTNDENEYKIESNDMERELYMHLRKAVQVEGTVKRKCGKSHLLVKRYQILRSL